MLDSATCNKNAFSTAARTLVAHGYSPLPIIPGTKRPALKRGWSEYCSRILSEETLAHFETGNFGIGVACGFANLVAVDIDTEAKEIAAKIDPLLPKVVVAKQGRRGCTIFGRDPSGGIISRKFWGNDGMLVEILASGNQTVIPPTVHPETQQPYRYLTDRSLLDTHVDQLPVFPLDFVEHLEVALKPWLKKESNDADFDGVRFRPKNTPIDDCERKRLESWARAKLRNRCAEIASMAKDSGRNLAAFRLACGIGRFVHHGVISEREIIDALLAACEASGLLHEDGRPACLASIRSGLSRAKNDPLPDLQDRTHGASSSFHRGDTGRFSEAKERSNTADWGIPLPLPELPSVAAFDLDLMPDSLRDYVEDIAETMQAPPDFVAVASMVGLGSVLGRKIGIRPQEETNWTEVPNLWGVVIGRPGVMKSPSIRSALGPLDQLIAKALTEYETDGAEHKIKAAVAKIKIEENARQAKQKLKQDRNASIDSYFKDEEEPEEPKLRRYKTSDATPAALGELLLGKPNGILVHRDELVSLLQNLEREDNAEGRGFYMTGWNGDDAYTIDRIGRGMHLHIPAVCLSVLGSTQPGKISRYLTTATRGGPNDDGLIQRFGLLVWPDVNPDWRDVDRPLNSAAKRKAFKLYERLDQLDPFSIGAKQDRAFDGEPEGIPYLRLDPSALQLFRDWRTGFERRLRGGQLHPAFESHLVKYRKLVPVMALISHVADSGTGPISETALIRALSWAEYLETHATRAYAGVTMPATQAAKAILGKIKSGALSMTFGTQDIIRPQWSMLTGRSEILEALKLLEEHECIRSWQESTPGRPRIIYEFNPKLKP